MLRPASGCLSPGTRSSNQGTGRGHPAVAALPLETNSGATANRNGKIEEVLDKVHSRLLLCRRTRSPITSEQRKDAAPEQIVGRLSLEPQVTAARWRHEAVVA